MQCERVLCIRGNNKQAWLPVPLKGEGALAHVPLNATRSPWIVKLLLSGTKKSRDPGECALVLKAFEAQVRKGNPQVRKGNQWNVEPVERVAANTATPRKTKKACALSLDSDDEPMSQASICSSPQSGGTCSGEDDRPAASGAKRPRRGISVGKGGMFVRTLEEQDGSAGKSVTLGVGSGPGLLIGATADNVVNVVKYIDDNFDRLADVARSEQAARMRAEGAPASSQNPPAPQEAASGQHTGGDQQPGLDARKIRFDMKTGGFILHHQGDTGKMHRLSQGFVVQRLDFMGVPLGAELYAQAKGAMLRRAREKWNELDKSKALRYEFKDE